MDPGHAPGSALRHQEDGDTSSDFRHVDNAVEANLLAAVSHAGSAAVSQVHAMVRELVLPYLGGRVVAPPEYRPFRPGDVSARGRV